MALKYLVIMTIEKMKKTKKNPSRAIKMISAMRNAVPSVWTTRVLDALSVGLENIQCEQVSLVHSAFISRGLPLTS